MNNAHGGVSISGMIDFFPVLPKSLFERSSFEEQILLYCHDMWGDENNSSGPGDKGDEFITYPVEEGELKYIEINNAKWCCFTSQITGKAPRVEYVTAITSQHLIYLHFVIDTYKSLDFYSPKTNIEQASFKVIEDFMNNFKIELSEKSKLQLSEAKNPI